MQLSRSSFNSVKIPFAMEPGFQTCCRLISSPVAWRSILTGGCIETGTEIWDGGANYYTVAQICVGGVDAANSLMAVKKLVYDDKKVTMAELRKALAANFEGEYAKVGKMCFEAPKHGNDIPEVNRFVHRVNDSIL